MSPVKDLKHSPDLLPLFGKAAVARFTKRGGSQLPDTRYHLHGVTVDPHHLAAYNEVCGFGLADSLPATYPHVLSFPVQTKLMTDDDFPFPLIGSVHVNNTITVLQPLRVRDKFDLVVHVENLRDHPSGKGRLFDVVTKGLRKDEEVWTDVSTYMAPVRTKASASPKSPGPRNYPDPTIFWRLESDLGRRYAAASGDYNPIHLYPLTAKAFGFPRNIAHGMWTKARSLAVFDGQLPDSYAVDVAFKQPVLLPSKIAFGAVHDGAKSWHFALTNPKNGKPHLEGAIKGL
jgi:hypothetical protein